MEAEGLSIRDLVERMKSAHSHTAVWNWTSKGHIPSESDSVRDLADALRIPRARLLELADYRVKGCDLRLDMERHPDDEQVKSYVALLSKLDSEVGDADVADAFMERLRNMAVGDLPEGERRAAEKEGAKRVLAGEE